MIESIAHISSSLRAAATQCDSFVKIVAKHHPTSAAAAIANMGNEFLALANSAGAGALAGSTGLTASGVTGQSAAPPSTPGPGHGGRRPLSKEEKAEARKLRKANRDPDAPKRPPSAYLLFQNEVREDMRKRHPELTYGQTLAKISEAWKALTDDQRQVSGLHCIPAWHVKGRHLNAHLTASCTLTGVPRQDRRGDGSVGRREEGLWPKERYGATWRQRGVWWRLRRGGERLWRRRCESGSEPSRGWDGLELCAFFRLAQRRERCQEARAGGKASEEGSEEGKLIRSRGARPSDVTGSRPSQAFR